MTFALPLVVFRRNLQKEVTRRRGRATRAPLDGAAAQSTKLASLLWLLLLVLLLSLLVRPLQEGERKSPNLEPKCLVGLMRRAGNLIIARGI